MKRKQRIAGRTVLLALVALLLGVTVYTVNATRLAGDAVPMPFGVGAAVVLSGSMEPELSEGDLLIVVARGEYRVGDVVVYQDGGMAITHRIVAMTDDGVITRGDANNTNDAPIGYGQIKGRVMLAIPLVGYAVNAIKTPVGILCILALAVFLLERSLRTEQRADEKALDAIKAEIEKLKQEQNQNF